MGVETLGAGGALRAAGPRAPRAPRAEPSVPQCELHLALALHRNSRILLPGAPLLSVGLGTCERQQLTHESRNQAPGASA